MGPVTRAHLVRGPASVVLLPKGRPMLNDNLRPVLVAAADLETVQWEMDQAVQLLEEAMRRALLEGIALDRVASAAGMTAGEVISRTGMQLRGQGPDRALEPA